MGKVIINHEVEAVILMTETIEVFFKNENNAESAQAQLRTLKVVDMYIEEMPEDARTTLYVPVFPASLDTNTTGSARGPITPALSSVVDDVSGPDYPSYLLYVEIETDDYEQALEILQNHEYYVRKED